MEETELKYDHNSEGLCKDVMKDNPIIWRSIFSFETALEHSATWLSGSEITFVVIMFLS